MQNEFKNIQLFFNATQFSQHKDNILNNMKAIYDSGQNCLLCCFLIYTFYMAQNKPAYIWIKNASTGFLYIRWKTTNFKFLVCRKHSRSHPCLLGMKFVIKTMSSSCLMWRKKNPEDWKLCSNCFFKSKLKHV